MKRIMILSTLICMYTSMLHAAEMNSQQARAAVQTIIGQISARTGYPILPRQNVREFRGEDNTIIAYIQDLDPVGFIITTADDDMTPLLGYSLTHDFVDDADPENVMYHMIRQDNLLRKTMLQSRDQQQINQHKSSWKNLIEISDGALPILEKVWPETGTTITGGWLNTLWHQEYPYNARCPYDDVNDGRSVVGCVATAMAQIINFHGFPNDVGDFSDADDYVSSYNGFTFNVDDDCGTNETLRWDELNSLLDSVTYPLSSTSDAGLIDELCYACGVAVEMNYSESLSGAATANVGNALRNHFGYENALWCDTSYSDFFTEMKSNMINAQPAEMAIRKYSGGGHAIVVDGFDEVNAGTADDLYHLNYGWGSQSYCYWWNLLSSSFPQQYDYISGAVLNIDPGNSYFVIENTGMGDLHVSSIAVDKSWLDLTPDVAPPFTLAYGENIHVSYEITDWSSVAAPEETATVTIYSDDPDETPEVSITAHRSIIEPNLIPYQQPNWDDVLVVSSVTGTNTDSDDVVEGQPMYIDFSYFNDSDADIPSSTPFDNTVYLDGSAIFINTEIGLVSHAHDKIEDITVNAPAAGWHTIAVQIDTGDAIAESNESDNYYEKEVYINPAEEGLNLYVEGLSGEPLQDGVVRVYPDTTSFFSDAYEIVDGHVSVPGIEPGQYDLLVYSVTEQCFFVLYDVAIPTVLELYVSDLEPVTVTTVGKDGVTPCDASIRFIPFSQAKGELGWTGGQKTYHISDVPYNGISVMNFEEPYLLVYRNPSITGGTTLEFNPVTMPTGTVNPVLDGFDRISFFPQSDYAYASTKIELPAGEDMVLSTGTYNLHPEIYKDSGTDSYWCYVIANDDIPYSSMNISENQVFELYAGGAFTISAHSENASYQSGESVTIYTDISDAYGNSIVTAAEYTPDTASSKVVSDEPFGTMAEYETYEKGLQGVFPSIYVYDPLGSIIDYHEDAVAYNDFWFDLPDPTPNGTYVIDYQYDTGPHNGVIKTTNHFIVGDYSTSPVVTSILPETGTNTGTVNITSLTGSNFLPCAEVKLTRAGYEDILGYDVDVIASDEINCTFDLTGAAVGTWNVVVTNADMQNSGTTGDGLFTITDESEVSYYAVLIGIADYPGTVNDLNYTDDDVIDMYDALVARPEWQDADILTLLDSQATKQNMQDAVLAMQQNADADDICLFFYSGHGTNMPDVAPLDEADGYDEGLYVYDGTIIDDEFGTWFESFNTDNLIILFDACYSGGQIKTPLTGLKTVSTTSHITALGDGFAADLSPIGYTKDLDDTITGVVLTACDDGETCVESSSLQNGLFTYCVVEGMTQQSTDTNFNDWISAEEVFAYAAPLATQLYNGQHAQLFDAFDNELDFITAPVGTQYTLTISTDPPGSGYTNPAAAEQHLYSEHEVVPVHAYAYPMYEFSHWTGNVADPDAATTTVTMNGDTQLTAHFEYTGDIRVDDLVASVDGPNIVLDWSPLLGADTYNVYRGTTWDFVPDYENGTNRIGEKITDEDTGRMGIQWTDTGNGAQIVGDPGTNYFYRVTAYIAGTPPASSAKSTAAISMDGVPHTAMGEVFNSDSSSPPDGAVDFTAFIGVRPTEILTETSTGCGYVDGYWFVNVGNFPTAWSIGEILHVDVVNTLNNETGSIDLTLTSNDPDTMPVLLAYLVESAPSNIACEFDYELVTTPTTDINEIVLFADTRRSRNPVLTAEDLVQKIPGCTVLYGWDATSQSSIGHPAGMPFNLFDVHPGYPYSINVTENVIWTVAGALPDTTFNLITTETTDINHISLLHQRASLTNAEALAQDIPHCTVIYQWDAASQSSIGHPIGMPFNIFDTELGQAYWVNVTDESWWPSTPTTGQQVAARPSTPMTYEELPNPVGGVPHMVFNNFTYPAGMTGNSEDLALRAWIIDRPEEVVTSDMIGTGIDGDYWWIGVNNFPTPWQSGDILRVEIEDPTNGLVGFENIVLSDAGYDNGETVALENISDMNSRTGAPLAYILYPNTPNPFNPSTQISYGIPEQGNVQIRVYDILGRVVTTLIDETQEPGYATIVWNGTDTSGNSVATGIYLLEMKAQGYRHVQKMLFVK